jgi:ADP-dependent NAD(P)H-hydrate dehydratase / NAD(P)H-hydrate epimerase
MNIMDMMVVDENAEALGISKTLLMENAGKCIAQKIFEISKPCKVNIYAGTGGNGGDGFVTARYLLNNGFEVEIFLIGHPSRISSPESLKNWEVLHKLNIETNSIVLNIIEDHSQFGFSSAELVVDAILGTGTKGKIREPVSKAIDIINNSNSTVIAVDIPTGLDPQTGMVEHKAVKADFTVTFHKKKIGLKNADDEYLGDLKVCDIGIPEEAELYTGPGDLLRLNQRNINSHKGQNGNLLVLGGSKDYSGAPALAAISALRSGVDISVIACPKCVTSTIRSYSPDLIVKSLSNNYVTFDDTAKILELSKNANSMVIGCGIGREEETGLALTEMIEKINMPIVIDADALKLLNLDLIKHYRNEVILTPHKAEFKAFFGVDVPKKLDNQIDTILECSKKCKCTVLLKGSTDIISNGDKIKLNSTGNPGMTVGGTGDVLAGIVGALVAQGQEAFEAAYLGSFINGNAGDLAAEEYGYNLIASDIWKYIPQVFKRRI